MCILRVPLQLGIDSAGERARIKVWDSFITRLMGQRPLPNCVGRGPTQPLLDLSPLFFLSPLSDLGHVGPENCKNSGYE